MGSNNERREEFFGVSVLMRDRPVGVMTVVKPEGWHTWRGLDGAGASLQDIRVGRAAFILSEREGDLLIQEAVVTCVDDRSVTVERLADHGYTRTFEKTTGQRVAEECLDTQDILVGACFDFQHAVDESLKNAA